MDDMTAPKKSEAKAPQKTPAGWLAGCSVGH